MAVLLNETWTGDNGADWPAAWTTSGVLNDIQGNRGRQQGGNGYAGSTGLRALSHANGAYEFTFQMSRAESEAYCGIVVRKTGSVYYQIEASVQYGGFILYKNTGGGNNNVAQHYFSGNFVTTTLYRGKIVLNGSVVQFRFWPDGTQEPTTWPINYTDPTPIYDGTHLELFAFGGDTAGVIDWFWDNLTFDDGVDGPTAPVISSVTYAAATRLGPNNTPATVTFSSSAPHEPGADALSYQIRTATLGGGTLVGSGTMTSEVAKQHTIANDAPGLVDGTQVLYIRVSDGTLWSPDTSFNLLRDTGMPTVGTILHIPNPVGS